MALKPPKLFACDIARYSDAELDQYLEANGRLITVEDPENLPEDFLQRLRIRAGASNAAPIDLDDLMTRLENIPPSPTTRPENIPPPSISTTPSLNNEESYRYFLEKETEYYNILVNEGGRPSHPVSLGRDVIENPEYREILSYWQKVAHTDWKVFQCQKGEWQDFRQWQRNNREEGRFLKYVEGVKGGLAEHGFTRSFQLNEDPDRQDKLTTWIEFLDYEYWWYDKDIRYVKHHQQRYNEAWKKLVDSQVLRPFETEEFICDNNISFECVGEKDRAKEAVESAKSALMSAQKPITDPRCSSLSQRESRQKLAAAQSRLDEAVKSLESVKRRVDLILEFYQTTLDYRIGKGNVECREILLRWMLQQVPLIELELNPAKAAENDSNGQNGRKLRSKRSRVDESNKERVSTRQRQDGESNPVSDRRTRASTTKERETPLKRSYHDVSNEERASKRPKRNDKNNSLSRTSDATNPTSIERTLTTQPPTTQGSGATAARVAKAHSISHSALKKTRSETNALDKMALDGKARVVKRGRRGGKSSNLSTSGSPPLRRGSRMRKPPDRFQ